ncbi:MAG: hypothetical protein Q8Q20_05670 [bacterium]|nr:hypothetical protein [bacterium]
MRRYIAGIVSVVLVVVVDVSFLNKFEFFYSYVTLYVLASMFAILILPIRRALIWIIGLGLVADVFSGLGYGLITGALFFSSVVGYMLFATYFSHRSGLTSVFLIGLMTSLYWICLNAFSVLYFLVGLSDIWVGWSGSFWLLALSHSLVTSLTFTVIYAIFSNVLRRFRERFVITRT